MPAARVDDNRLYRALDQLLPHKEKLEAFLKDRLGELFDLEYDLLLYDITSTYFEGQSNFPLAQRGCSRDQRSDCKQVCLGLVVSRGGMPLGYEVFAGRRGRFVCRTCPPEVRLLVTRMLPRRTSRAGRPM